MPPFYMKHLMDSVHGSIPISILERNVIDEPLFQRLRYIKQNDILYMTFMGATHTRFSHSLGVMHIGTRIFDRLFPLDYNQHSVDYWQSVDYLRRVLRLALLLHDVGHTALSHLVEHLGLLENDIYDSANFDILWEDIHDKEIVEAARKGLGYRLTHENYSSRIAYEVLTSLSVDRFMVIDILSLMDGFETRNQSTTFLKSSCCVLSSFEGPAFDEFVCAKQVHAILREIISGEADADKFDYILRDSKHAGVGYGNFDVEGVINTFRIIYSEAIQKYVITVSENGLSALCDLISSRYNMFCHINNHKGNNGFEVLFSKALSELLDNEEFRDEFTHMMLSLGGFRYLNDDFVMYHIGAYGRHNENSYCRRFLDRKNVRHVLTVRDNMPTFTGDELAMVEKNFPNERIEVNEKRVKFSNIDKSYDGIMVRVKRFASQSVELKKLGEATDYFDKYASFTQYGYYVL